MQATLSATSVTSLPTTTLPAGAMVHIPDGLGINILNVRMIDSAHGWGLGGRGSAQAHVFRTQDGGETWKDVTPPQPAPPAGSETIAAAYFFGTQDAWVAYGVNTAPPPAYIYIWATHDGGGSWRYTAVDSSLSSEYFNPQRMFFADADHGWLLVYMGAGMSHSYVALLGTSDGGNTWQALVTPMDAVEIQACPKTGMVFSDALNGWLARGCQGLYPSPHILRSTDGGTSWMRIEPPAPADEPDLYREYACDMASPNAFSASSAVLAMKCVKMSDYKTEKDFLYATTDGGTSWNSHPLPADYSMGEGLMFFDPLNGFALGRRIYRTSDGGQTWKFMQQVYWDGQFSFLNATQGWAAVINDNRETALVVTGDGGLKWKLLNPLVIP